MGYRKNNLNAFFINKDDNEQDQNLIDMWHWLDQDFSENSENTNFNVLKAEGKNYKSLAEKSIKDKEWIEENYDDVAKINKVLEWIKEGHGGHSSQFLYEVTECEEGYAVAVSYLT